MVFFARKSMTYCIVQDAFATILSIIIVTIRTRLLSRYGELRYGDYSSWPVQYRYYMTTRFSSAYDRPVVALHRNAINPVCG